LERFVNGEPIQARSVHLVERGWRWCRRHPGVAVPSALAALLLLVAAGVSLQDYRSVSAANAKLETANKNLDGARQSADRNAAQAQQGFALASRSMEQTVTRIAQNERLMD